MLRLEVKLQCSEIDVRILLRVDRQTDRKMLKRISSFLRAVKKVYLLKSIVVYSIQSYSRLKPAVDPFKMVKKKTKKNKKKKNNNNNNK